MTDGTTTRTPSAPVLVGGLAATLGLAAACWVGTVRWTSGMDLGTATSLGTFAHFIPAWLVMTAAMMLPAAAPTVVRHARGRGMRAAPGFVAAYLAVWALVGFAVYALYRPHGSVVAGVLVLAAGGYEFTPVKRYCRRRCHQVRSGSELGLYCVGSNAGLMLLPLALGPMSVAWMGVAAVLMVAQRLLPAKTAVDVPVGLAILGLGALVLVAPSAVPGLMTQMTTQMAPMPTM